MKSIDDFRANTVTVCSDRQKSAGIFVGGVRASLKVLIQDKCPGCDCGSRDTIIRAFAFDALQILHAYANAGRRDGCPIP